MILITGATGKLGSIVIETLLRNNVPAHQIAALVRDEKKAASLKEQGIQIRIGDYDDRASLEEAMQGINRVLLVSGLDMTKVVEQHKSVINAAKQAGVTCLGYTSNCLRYRDTVVNSIMKTHFETEDYLIASGLNYLIFRNVLYMDSMAHYMLGNNVMTEGLHLPAGDGRVSYALRSDEAEAIGNVLTGDDCTSRIYNFTGSHTYSFYDVAQALSELSGRQISYIPTPIEAYKQKAIEQGMPQHVVEMMAPFYADIENGQGSLVTHELEDALGHPPTALKTGLKQLLNL